jgi:hypothetical protein
MQPGTAHGGDSGGWPPLALQGCFASLLAALPGPELRRRCVLHRLSLRALASSGGGVLTPSHAAAGSPRYQGGATAAGGRGGGSGRGGGGGGGGVIDVDDTWADGGLGGLGGLPLSDALRATAFAVFVKTRKEIPDPCEANGTVTQLLPGEPERVHVPLYVSVMRYDACVCLECRTAVASRARVGGGGGGGDRSSGCGGCLDRGDGGQDSTTNNLTASAPHYRLHHDHYPHNIAPRPTPHRRLLSHNTAQHHTTHRRLHSHNIAQRHTTHGRLYSHSTAQRHTTHRRLHAVVRTILHNVTPPTHISVVQVLAPRRLELRWFRTATPDVTMMPPPPLVEKSAPRLCRPQAARILHVA